MNCFCSVTKILFEHAMLETLFLRYYPEHVAIAPTHKLQHFVRSNSQLYFNYLTCVYLLYTISIATVIAV